MSINRNCKNCAHFIEASGPTPSIDCRQEACCNHPDNKVKAKANLNSFPFKKDMKCWERPGRMSEEFKVKQQSG